MLDGISTGLTVVLVLLTLWLVLGGVCSAVSRGWCMRCLWVHHVVLPLTSRNIWKRNLTERELQHLA